MKKMYGKPVTLGLLSVLMVSVLFGSATARADVVLDWNTIAVNTAVTNHQNPFAQARYAAIVQLAVFEAVNTITGEFQPYLGTITAPPGASAEAAAIEAAKPPCMPIATTHWRPYLMAKPKMTASQPVTLQLWL